MQLIIKIMLINLNKISMKLVKIYCSKNNLTNKLYIKEMKKCLQNWEQIKILSKAKINQREIIISHSKANKIYRREQML
jgi:hypothetical protein